VIFSEALGVEHLQEFAKIYLANPVFCQLLKSYAKQKKEFISNSLA
jgi:nucleoside 2-deoxyribosyltransferase